MSSPLKTVIPTNKIPSTRMHPLRHPRILLSGELPNPLTTANQPPINVLPAKTYLIPTIFKPSSRPKKYRHPRTHPLCHPRTLLSGDLPITVTNPKQPPINLYSKNHPSQIQITNPQQKLAPPLLNKKQIIKILYPGKTTQQLNGQ